MFARAERHTRARLHSVNGQSVPSGNTQKGIVAWGEGEGEKGERV